MHGQWTDMSSAASTRSPAITTRLCAICDNLVDISTLCDACRDDPVNVDWVEPSRREVLGQELERGWRGRMADLCDRHITAQTPRQALIVRLMVTGKRVRNARPRRGTGGRHKGYGYHVDSYTESEIAVIAGCSQQYVNRVIRRHAENSENS